VERRAIARRFFLVLPELNLKSFLQLCQVLAVASGFERNAAKVQVRMSGSPPLSLLACKAAMWSGHECLSDFLL
jgi:hypothetical protein